MQFKRLYAGFYVSDVTVEDLDAEAIGNYPAYAVSRNGHSVWHAIAQDDGLIIGEFPEDPADRGGAGLRARNRAIERCEEDLAEQNRERYGDPIRAA